MPCLRWLGFTLSGVFEGFLSFFSTADGLAISLRCWIWRQSDLFGTFLGGFFFSDERDFELRLHKRSEGFLIFHDNVFRVVWKDSQLGIADFLDFSPLTLSTVFDRLWRANVFFSVLRKLTFLTVCVWFDRIRIFWLDDSHFLLF